MFDLVVIIEARSSGDVDGLRRALERMGPLCRAEPGCLDWQAYQSRTDPLSFTLVECWQSEEHWHAHDRLEAIQGVYIPEVVPRAATRSVHPMERL
jgi:quinol monooxygenase YgiN